MKEIRTPKKAWWNILKWVVALLLLVWVIQQVSLSDLLQLIVHVSWSRLLCAFVLFGVMSVIKAWQYWLVLPDSKYLLMWRAVLWQGAFSYLVANAAGIAALAGETKENLGIGFSKFTMAFVWVKSTDLFALSVLAILISSRLKCVLFGLHQQLGLGVWLGEFILLLSAGTLILFILFGKVKVFGKLHRFFPKKWLFNFNFEDYRQWLHRRATTSVIASMAYFIVTVAYAMFFYSAFGLQMKIIDLAFIVIVGQVFSFVPIHVLGGIGTSEALGVYLFTLFGIAYSQAAALMLGVRIVTTILQVFVMVSLLGSTVIINKQRG